MCEGTVRFLKTLSDWKDYCESFPAEHWDQNNHGNPPERYPCIVMCTGKHSYDTSSGRWTINEYHHAIFYPEMMEVKLLLKHMICTDREYITSLSSPLP